MPIHGHPSACYARLVDGRIQLALVWENRHNAGEFEKALAATNAKVVYFRYLPPNGQMEAVHRAKKRAFIAGTTVSGHTPENWQHAANVGIDGILTDYPLELAAKLKPQSQNQDQQ